MKSRINKEFRKTLRGLPIAARRQAYTAYRLFKGNPYHPSLQFKRVIADPPIYSVRIGLYYRALGVRRESDSILWFWIGLHEEYKRLIRR